MIKMTKTKKSRHPMTSSTMRMTLGMTTRMTRTKRRSLKMKTRPMLMPRLMSMPIAMMERVSSRRCSLRWIVG